MDQDAFSIDEFCKRNRVSRATFYNLRKCGLGPRVMKVGTRTLISADAAKAWRERMEKGGAPSPPSAA